MQHANGLNQTILKKQLQHIAVKYNKNDCMTEISCIVTYLTVALILFNSYLKVYILVSVLLLQY